VDGDAGDQLRSRFRLSAKKIETGLMDKKSIDDALDLNFKRLHWQRIRLCSMPPAFARDIDVSPYFLARPLRRSGGAYVISGHIGVVCQPFERTYLTKHGVPRASGKPWNPIWLAFHIANLPEVSGLAWISSEAGIPAFCENIASHLERMPHSVPALKEVIRKQMLFEKPLQDWVFARPEKLQALQQYLVETS